MFDPSDAATQKALFELRDASRKGKPIVIWVGAGASRWAGYPGWDDFAENLHSHFVKYEPRYEAKVGAGFLQSAQLPSVFSLCKTTNPLTYFQILSSTFANREMTPVYKRLLELLSGIDPLMILTTNIDESLEANLPNLDRHQRSDIEFAERALIQRKPFICKLHGTSSAIESTIWSDEDYRELALDHPFIASLSRILSNSSVVFLGYGLRDEYVIKLLEERESVSRILGSGPHFLVSPTARELSNLQSVRTIRYLANDHTDHRGALAVIDELRAPYAPKDSEIKRTEEKTSAMYLADYLTPGIWHTSQTITFSDLQDKPKGKAFIGNGFNKSEVPNSFTTSLHDLLVGLLCFDKIYLPLNSLGKLHQDVGADLFWLLLRSDVLRLIWITGELAVIFDDPDEVAGGNIGSLNLMDKLNPEQRISFEDQLLKQIRPREDNERNRLALIDDVLKITVRFDENVLSSVPMIAQGALASPRLRTSLGIGDGVLPTKLPEWFVFPALRVAHVVRDAEICRAFGLSSAKMPFASDGLANATYGLTSQDMTAGKLASYVVTGKFNADLGSAMLKTPALVSKVVHFRESQEGLNFRREVFEQLHKEEGSEFVASVNAALKGLVPTEILQRACTTFADLHMSGGSVAIWSADVNLGDPFAPWRKRSGDILREICDRKKIGVYDLCPCGSGDKLKFCCGSLLQ